MNKSTRLYAILALSVGAIWGMGFLVLKRLLVSGMPVLLLMALRFILGAFIIMSVQQLRGRRKYSAVEWKYGVIVGVALAAGFITQTYGLRLTTPSKNAMITGAYVVICSLLSLIFGKKRSVKPLFDALLCFGGVVLVSGYIGGTANLGDLLTLICAFAFAIQFLLVERFAPRCDAVSLAVTQLTVAGAICLVGSLLFESGGYASIDFGAAVVGVLYMGLLSTGYAYFVQNSVQKKLSASMSALLLSSESAFGVIFSLCFGYDKATPSLIIGSILIAAAIVSSIVFDKNGTNEFNDEMEQRREI